MKLVKINDGQALLVASTRKFLGQSGWKPGSGTCST